MNLKKETHLFTITNMIYWFTGQPGAGKTTLANGLNDYYHKNKISFLHILVDGDDLRLIFNNNDYGENGRIKNIERAQDISKFLHSKKYIVFVALVSPYKELREKFKREMGNNIKEIYVHTTDERGREKHHVEYYDKPTENFIDIDTTNKSVDESLNELLKKLNYVL